MNRTNHLYRIIGEQAEEIRALKMAYKKAIDNGLELYFDREEARDWANYYKKLSETVRPIYTIT